MRLTDFIKLVSPSKNMFGRSLWSASIGQAECKGASSDDALNGLKETIEIAFEGHYSPGIIQYGKYQGMVWRTPYNWKYCILQCSATCIILHGVTAYATKEDAIAAMGDHVRCME
jgi:hypothetical protein